jgi:hypothetical protein
VPAFAGKSFNSLARNRGIKFDHRFTALNWRIGSAANDRAGFQERLPGAGAGDRFGVPLALIYGMDVPVNKNESASIRLRFASLRTGSSAAFTVRIKNERKRRMLRNML